MPTSANPSDIDTSPKRILIVRLSAIGDVIMTTSLLPALRARYPRAHITWLTEPLGAEILKENPLIDRLLLLPRKEWIKQWKSGQKARALKAAIRFGWSLRNQRFDLAIDPQGLLKSGIWTWASRAPVRVGLHGREGSGWLMTHVVRDSTDVGGPLVREYRVLAERLSLPMEAFGMSLGISDSEHTTATRTLSASDKPPIFLLPFTTRPQKHWFSERWSELADKLLADNTHSVWILGGPGDLEEAGKIAAGVRGDIHVVAGPQSDLREKMALLQQSSLSIGVDTGLTHLSLGLRRPTIALFGSTCPYASTDPIPGHVFYDRLECSPCHRHPTCEGRFDCMRGITCERILDKAAEFLSA